MLKRRRVEADASSRPGILKKTKTDSRPDKAATKSHAAALPNKPTVGQNAEKNGHRPLSHSEAKTDHQLNIQIITGSYERVLHGFIATLPATSTGQVTFSDNFLLTAHTSSVRSLAVSPPSESASNKRILATGSSDERINLYHIASTAPHASITPAATSLLPTSNSKSRNHELGSLLHHSRTVTRLSFPTKGKLFSAADDNTIAITRVRDWTMLSSIKAPLPKPQGRPSGDTASPGEVPAGVNDFAIHPSMKIMISVSKGERCMRLWNLVTGKKAGVLSFDRDVLAQVGEGRFATGEGRKVLWDGDGERFVVVFERGAVVYDMDSRPVAAVVSKPVSKVHQARFVPGHPSTLALSTEDGRILFFDTSGPQAGADADATTNGKNDSVRKLPVCPCLAQISTEATDSAGRIKDFELLPTGQEQDAEGAKDVVCVAATSAGTVTLWTVSGRTLSSSSSVTAGVKSSEPAVVSTLLGIRESGNRLTCLTAFVMDPSDEKEPGEDESVDVQEDGVPGSSDEE